MGCGIGWESVIAGNENTCGWRAGHGSQTTDWSGDEDDGYNETICPCDFQQVRALCAFPMPCEAGRLSSFGHAPGTVSPGGVKSRCA
jgi:hypothetical protein